MAMGCGMMEVGRRTWQVQACEMWRCSAVNPSHMRLEFPGTWHDELMNHLHRFGPRSEASELQQLVVVIPTALQ